MSEQASPAYDEVSDEALMRAYVAGDQAAFRTLFDRFGRQVTGRLQRSVGSTVALDLAQQTFLQLHRSRRDFREGALVRPWLMTIAHNVLRDHLRKIRRRPGDLPIFDDPQSRSADGLAGETREVVRAAVDGLPESQRVVVQRHWLDQRSHAEIAKELGISKGAVKVRAHRAYQTLRRVLGAKGYAT